MAGSKGPRSRAEIAEITDRCVELRRQGLTQRAIAARLGVAPTSVSNYLRSRNEPHVRIMKSSDELSTLPVADLPPAYTRSVTVHLLGSTERELRELNAEHCFAGDLADARAAGDGQWLRAAEDTLQRMQAYLNRLTALLGDDSVQACDADRRDDVAQIEHYRNKPRKNRAAGEPWTASEDAVAMRGDLSLNQISRKLGRSYGSVRARRGKLRKRAAGSMRNDSPG